MTIRAKGEPLSSGGESSGVLSFLKVFDQAAGATKSGGINRRAAKMVALDIDHPDIIDFINWKVKEEEKAKALIEAGYSSDMDGEAYDTVSGQNSNKSVVISNSFMEAYHSDSEWRTVGRVDKNFGEIYRAKELLLYIAEASHKCGCPGVQFSDTINKWNTVKNIGKIRSSNPCLC